MEPSDTDLGFCPHKASTALRVAISILWRCFTVKVPRHICERRRSHFLTLGKIVWNSPFILFGNRLTKLGYPGDAVEVCHAGRICVYDLLDDSRFRRGLAWRGTDEPVFNLNISLPANECTGRQRGNSVGPDQQLLPSGTLGDATAKGTPSKWALRRTGHWSFRPARYPAPPLHPRNNCLWNHRSLLVHQRQGLPQRLRWLMRDQFTAPFSILESVGARITIAAHNAAVVKNNHTGRATLHAFLSVLHKGHSSPCAR